MRPPAWPALGPQVDDPVGRLDHLDVVLDHQHGIARGHETVQHVQQQLDVGEVQAGGGLVQQVERPAGALLDQLAGELDRAGPRRRRGWATAGRASCNPTPRRAASATSAAIGGMFSKCASASWMSISSTSAIDLPL